jgi:hypothetical protein
MFGSGDGWTEMGRGGKPLRSDPGGRGGLGDRGGPGERVGGGPKSLAEKSQFSKNYAWGLKNDWFSALKEMERVTLEEVYRAGDKCPNTILAQVPIGYHGNPDQVMDGIRVSLCRIKVGDNFLKPGVEDGDFRVTSMECQTLFSIQFKEEVIKNAILKLGEIPWFKKQGKEDVYKVVEKKIRFIDLVRPKVTLVVTHYLTANNVEYNKALIDFYKKDGMEVEIEEGTKKQWIDMGEGKGYLDKVFNGKKYVKLSFPDSDYPVDIDDGKVDLFLEGIGSRSVFITQLGKKYPCSSCGGLECERFYCMNKCVYCRRDLRSGHKQSECEERGIIDARHLQKTRDIEKTWNAWYSPAIVAGSSKVAKQRVLEEREMVGDKVAFKVEQCINHRVHEAKSKAFRGDTPYEPVDLNKRLTKNGGKGVKNKGDSRTKELEDALAGRNKRRKAGGEREHGEGASGGQGGRISRGNW